MRHVFNHSERQKDNWRTCPLCNSKLVPHVVDVLIRTDKAKDPTNFAEEEHRRMSKNGKYQENVHYFCRNCVYGENG